VSWSLRTKPRISHKNEYKNYVNVKNKLKNVMGKNITKMARLKDVMRMNIKQAQNSATNKLVTLAQVYTSSESSSILLQNNGLIFSIGRIKCLSY
jgi:hypothetical protein